MAEGTEIALLSTDVSFPCVNVNFMTPGRGSISPEKDQPETRTMGKPSFKLPLKLPFKLPLKERGAKQAKNVSLVRLFDGLGAVSIHRSGKGKPVVDLCHFQPMESGGEQPTFSALVNERKLARATFNSVVTIDEYEIFPEERPEKIPDAELANAMRWRLKDRLDYSPSEAVVDVFDMPAKPREESSGMIFVAAAKETCIQADVALFKGTHARLTGSTIHEIAMRNMASFLPEDKEGVALLHLRARDGLLTVTRRGQLYIARKMEIGTDQIFDFIQDNGGDEAEALAKKGPVDRISREIQRTLDYYANRFTLPPITSCYLAPLDIVVPPFRAALSDRMSIRIKRLMWDEMFEFPDGLPSWVDLGKCLPAFGAALADVIDKPYPQQVDLLEERFRPKVDIVRGTNVLLAGAFLLILFSGLSVYLPNKAAQAQSAFLALQNRERAMAAEVEMLAVKFPEPKEDPALQQEINQVRSEIELKRLMMGVLEGGGTFGNTEGFSGYFQELGEIQVPGLWLDRIRILEGGKEFGLNGRSLEPAAIARMVQLFKEKKRLSGHQFRFLKLKDKKESPGPGLAFALMTNEMKEDVVEEEQGPKPLFPDAMDPMALLGDTPFGKAFSLLGK